MTAPSAPAHPRVLSEESRRPAFPRRFGPARSAVVLGPLITPSAPDRPARGYLASLPHPFATPGEELTWVRWTLEALAVLAPGTFLVTPLSPQALLDPEAEPAIGESADRLLPVLESARVGARRRLLDEAVAAARELGLRCALGGHRVTSAAGFDAVVVRPATAAAELRLDGCPLLIGADLTSREHLRWAVAAGAGLVDGPAVAEPLRMAPVDVSRLQR